MTAAVLARAASVTLYCDGQAVGKGRVDQTQGFIFSADETTDIGYESGTTVSPDYTAHGSRFNGKINLVQIDLDKDAQDADHYISPDERCASRWRDSSSARSVSRRDRGDRLRRGTEVPRCERRRGRFRPPTADYCTSGMPAASS